MKRKLRLPLTTEVIKGLSNKKKEDLIRIRMKQMGYKLIKRAEKDREVVLTMTLRRKGR